MTSKGVQGMRRLSLAGALGVLLAAFAASCGGATAGTAVVGSESHFLTRCSERCGGAFECIGGICTKGCLTGDDTCGALHEGAVCTNQSVEPGQVAVCDVPCTEDSACAGLGNGFACDGTFCREVEGLPSAPVLSAAECAPYLDEAAPPFVRGITIINAMDVTVYVQQFSPGCAGFTGFEPALVTVLPLGASDARSMNIYGPGCSQSCQSVIENGPDGTPAPNAWCDDQQCPVGSRFPWVAIEPGQSVFEATRREFFGQLLPKGCASGNPAEDVYCQQRRIPATVGAGHTLNLTVAARPDCDVEGCSSTAISQTIGDYYSRDHTIEITAL